MKTDATYSEAEEAVRGLSAEALRRMIVKELTRAIGAGGTQERFALDLGYASAAQVNKILKGHANLPLAKARQLDDSGYVTSCGTTFAFLASRQVELRSRIPSSTIGQFDLFLALPMASTDEFAEIQDAAERMVEAIQNSCNYRVYCAALKVAGPHDFESSAFALSDNMAALRNSDRFALWLPGPLPRPSSIWVEVGVALALQLHCTFLVPGPEVLPYILTEARDAPMAGFGTVKFHWTKGVDPARLIRRHKEKLFSP